MLVSRNAIHRVVIRVFHLITYEDQWNLFGQLFITNAMRTIGHLQADVCGKQCSFSAAISIQFTCQIEIRSSGSRMDLVMENVYNCIEAINLKFLSATKSWTSWKDEKKITCLWVTVLSTLLIVICAGAGAAAGPKPAPIIQLESTTEEITSSTMSSAPSTTVDYWNEPAGTLNPVVDIQPLYKWLDR